MLKPGVRGVRGVEGVEGGRLETELEAISKHNRPISDSSSSVEEK